MDDFIYLDSDRGDPIAVRPYAISAVIARDVKGDWRECHILVLGHEISVKQSYDEVLQIVKDYEAERYNTATSTSYSTEADK